MLRALFISLSESKWLRSLSERSSLGKQMSGRFVAGMQVEDVLAATKEINRLGMSVSIDNLGENVADAAAARESAALYHELLDQISARGLDANCSLKLTHMGLNVDENLAHTLVRELLAHAVQVNSFLRVDMEGSAYTQKTIDFTREMHRESGHGGKIGTVIQSYLRRSEQDVQTLCQDGIRIRLCKGAYQEPPEIAFPKKADVDSNYVKLMKLLLNSGIYHGIATHDEKMIAATIAFAREQNITADRFEFQMLYGVRRDLQQELVQQGWRMRVYIPFGTEWYPYLMRRLAERPANALFIARNLFR